MTTKLTAAEVTCAALIQRVRMAPGVSTFWLPISYVMAHAEIESGFDPAIKASDYATTGSIGLMQVSAETARETLAAYGPALRAAGLIESGPTSQTDALTSLATGMLYLRVCYDYLLPIFKAPLAYAHVAVGYNAGPGNAGRLGLQEALANRYYLKWLSAQQRFAALDASPPMVAAA